MPKCQTVDEKFSMSMNREGMGKENSVAANWESEAKGNQHLSGTVVILHRNYVAEQNRWTPFNEHYATTLHWRKTCVAKSRSLPIDHQSVKHCNKSSVGISRFSEQPLVGKYRYVYGLWIRRQMYCIRLTVGW